jgi:hypothetical protein
LKLEIFVTPTTQADTIASAFPTRRADKLLNTDDKNGIVTLEIGGSRLPDPLIEWIDTQKEQGKIERIETE